MTPHPLQLARPRTPRLRTLLPFSLNPLSSHLKWPTVEYARCFGPRGLGLSRQQRTRHLASHPHSGTRIAGVVSKEHSSTLSYVFLTIPLFQNMCSPFLDCPFLLSIGLGTTTLSFLTLSVLVFIPSPGFGPSETSVAM